MKIAIAGYGVEGESSYNYWSTQDNDITIVDEQIHPVSTLPVGIKTILGSGVFENLDGFDIVVRSAGLNPGKIKTDGKIWSSTNEFFLQCPAPIIGVTGTKGKGTTASLIGSIYEAAGKTVWLVGNIGNPPLDVLEQIGSSDIVIFELSSFQLWDLERSPHVAVVLLIEPDHLDVHADMNDYVTAKGTIRRYQTDADLCVYNPANTYARSIALSNSNGKIMRYGVPDDMGVYSRDGYFLENEQIICSTDALQLIGGHNIDNACAALTVVRTDNVGIDAIEKGLRSFQGLPHRLKFVREYAGVRYYDDSIATTPGSAIAAIASFDQPKVLILGGSSKSVDFTELAQRIVKASVKAVILIGDEASHIEQTLSSVGYTAVHNLGTAVTMSQIVLQARAISQPGDVVILSPSCASFGMFKNYSDRGDQFIDAIGSLG